jgi:hypothetical protein
MTATATVSKWLIGTELITESKFRCSESAVESSRFASFDIPVTALIPFSLSFDPTSFFYPSDLRQSSGFETSLTLQLLVLTDSGSGSVDANPLTASASASLSSRFITIVFENSQELTMTATATVSKWLIGTELITESKFRCSESAVESSRLASFDIPATARALSWGLKASGSVFSVTGTLARSAELFTTGELAGSCENPETGVFRMSSQRPHRRRLSSIIQSANIHPSRAIIASKLVHEMARSPAFISSNVFPGFGEQITKSSMREARGAVSTVTIPLSSIIGIIIGIIVFIALIALVLWRVMLRSSSDRSSESTELIYETEFENSTDADVMVNFGETNDRLPTSGPDLTWTEEDRLWKNKVEEGFDLSGE